MDDATMLQRAMALLVGKTSPESRLKELLAEMVSSGYGRGASLVVCKNRKPVTAASYGEALEIDETSLLAELDDATDASVRIINERVALFPIVLGDHLAAALIAFMDRAGKPGAAACSVLTHVAAIAGALWREITSAEADLERSAQIQAVFNVAKLMAEPVDSGDPVPSILQQFVDASHAYAATLFRVDEDGTISTIVASAGIADTPTAAALKLMRPTLQTGGMVASAAASMRPVILNDYGAEKGEQARPEVVAAGIQSIGAFPAIHNGKCLGVVVLLSKELGYFTDKRASALASMVEILSPLLQSAQIRLAEAEKSRQLSAMLSVANLLVAPPEDGDPLPKVLELLSTTLNASSASLHRSKDNGATTNVVATIGLGAGGNETDPSLGRKGGVVSRVAAERKEYITNDYLAERGEGARSSLIAAGVRSMAAFPASHGSQLLGVVVLHSKEVGHFTPSRIQAAKAMVDSIASLIYDTELHEKVAEEQAIQRRKDALIAVTSHEFRTPLTSIVGYAELLLSRKTTPEQQRNWLERILEQGNHLTKIVETLLDVQRIREGNIALQIGPVHAAPAFQAVLEEMAAQAVNHRFVIDCPPLVPPVLADNEKLTQALRSLVDNAIKFSPNGGRITLSARANNDDGTVVFSVADQGIGISPEDAQRLFMAFERVDSRETLGIGGVGMGLYMVRSLVELMNGKVWVESNRGQGATFRIAIPQYGTKESQRALQSA